MIEIKDVNLTKDNLKLIEKLDNTFYEITDFNWYLERYNTHHSATLLFDNNKCVGYIFSVPIKKELYDAIINGVIINDIYINPKMFINESKYNYITSCLILKEYRNQGYGNELFKRILKDKNKIYVTLCISQGGIKLASKYMNLAFEINNNIKVYRSGDKQ